MSKWLFMGMMIVSGSALLLLPALALAQQCENGEPTSTCARQPRNFITNTQCACCGNCQLSDFVGLTVEVSRFIFGLAGTVALAMFVYGGFFLLTSGGSADRIKKGRDVMVAAVVGLAIVFGAWVLVNTILAALTGTVDSHGVAQILGGTWWKVPK